ncbi:MAG: HNH endonuclease signature motif containing protein [Bacillota bacterium]|uniref:HNH endonuclease signature motif containing protein n=1 Tax=Cytobacillus firmus TaxID=1399 RepID=UPI0018CE6F3C|nr:HNH endonuclease signature motif containing protein [Cytobacillus firmus]MBG9656080.1 phage protein [Cytobacillus firmus]MED1907847.1 HNH endonuclease signature motif containing protein [Cytobacillus firmus]
MARLFNNQQEAFIRANVKGLSNQELTDLINQEFGLNVTRKQVKAFKNNHRISSGLTGHFEKGCTPANKGTKGLYNVGGNRTSFKPGQKPKNYVPVGTERLDTDGYTLIKVQDDGPWHKRWKHKHKILWEEANGPIPKGHCLIFLDRNKQNLTLDNLQLITKKQLARLNQNHLISSDPEITKTGVIMADIYSKIGDRKKKFKEGRVPNEGLPKRK